MQIPKVERKTKEEADDDDMFFLTSVCQSCRVRTTLAVAPRA